MPCCTGINQPKQRSVDLAMCRSSAAMLTGQECDNGARKAALVQWTSQAIYTLKSLVLRLRSLLDGA